VGPTYAIPRHHVLSFLKCKGLNKAALYSAVILSERNFLDKFVVPYEKEIPELGEVYTAACQGKMPV
jgi:mTERF domain-containing protein, mitochondrial